MRTRDVEASPRRWARVTGAVYLLTMMTGIFAQMVISGRLVAGGDAAATAANIIAHTAVFQAGFAVYLFEMACNVAITALFFELLRPVSRSLSLLAAFFGLVGCAIKTGSRLFYLAPLFVLTKTDELGAFNEAQSQALALLFLEINDQGAAIGLVFFGFFTILKGYLILRSMFLPRLLGVLSIGAGFGWLTFMYPPLAHVVAPYVMALGLLGAIPQILWLLIIGVNEQRWREQAAHTGYRDATALRGALVVHDPSPSRTNGAQK
jgi:hypothetical protein